MVWLYVIIKIGGINLFDFFDGIIEFFTLVWDVITSFLIQLVAWFELLFTTTEFVSIIPMILPVTLSGIAVLTVGAAIVKAIFGR